MRSLDLKNVIDRRPGDNFTSVLFQLLLKADSTNIEKLAQVYPVEAKMVWLFHNNCIYTDGKDCCCTDGKVDYEALEREAINLTEIDGL